MGNRANLVIVENGQWQLHYSHWAGCRMLDALAFGPDFALRYIRSHRLCAKDEWRIRCGRTVVRSSTG
jgi:hypothetical protein